MQNIFAILLIRMFVNVTKFALCVYSENDVTGCQFCLGRTDFLGNIINIWQRKLELSICEFMQITEISMHCISMTIKQDAIFYYERILSETFYRWFFLETIVDVLFRQLQQHLKVLIALIDCCFR